VSGVHVIKGKPYLALSGIRLVRDRARETGNVELAADCELALAGGNEARGRVQAWFEAQLKRT
jgi:hypothetical protein